MTVIQGAKSGAKKQKHPYIAPDSVRSVSYAKLLYALSEGEIGGLVDDLRSVYLDETPVMAENGVLNFQGITCEFRSGTVNQEHIAGFPEVTNETSIGIELRSDNPWVKAINNTDLDAVRIRLSWPQLQTQTSNGDIVGCTIDYVIEISTDGGPYSPSQEYRISDKATSKYERSHRIELPEATSGWLIRVRRLTVNANSSLIADTMYIEAITEIVDAKLRYPNTALAGIIYDAEQFSNIAKFSAEIYGMIIKVPTNYDAETRQYLGVWDGSFKMAYSNNPAWIWYDLVLNARYGLGDRIDASMVNKWELYRIAQYCDELVPNGSGQLEPRFTCNVCIQEQQEAYSVLSDIASIFHGMSYWDGLQMVCIADMPTDPIYTFTLANIVGNPSYTGARRIDRHSVAQVAWDDPNNLYQTKKEPVYIQSQVKQLGVQPIEVGAFGCTSVGQAIRAGKWTLITEQKETRQATFTVGQDGANVKPGDIIKLSDPLLAGRENGGRIARVLSDKSFILDRTAVMRAGEKLTVNLPTGKSEMRIIQSVSGKHVTVTEKFSMQPEKQAIWAVDSKDLETMHFKVISRSRADKHQFTITAIQHEPDKFNYIDHSAIIDDKPITIIPPSVQAPPKNVSISQHVSIEQGLAVTTMTIAWDTVENATSYRVEWRRDSTQWVKEPVTGSLSIDIKGIYSGQYLARVYAINALGSVSVPCTSVLTHLQGKTGTPPVPAYFKTVSQLFGIQLDWGFPADAEDTAYTEIEQSETATGQTPSLVGNFSYPQDTHSLTGLSAGKRLWFRARLVDRTGNIGAWSKWTEGTASNDPSSILEILEGEITESQLGKQLLKKIDSAGEAAVEVEKVVNATAAMYSIKTQLTADGHTYIAGIGVGVENNEGIIESQVLVAADRFAVIHPNGEGIITPFIIQDGVVYMNSAFIQDATITMAKIKEALQSDNYIANTKGWRLDRNGNLEINGAVEGGGRLFINNEKVRVYDENNVLRVELGINL